MSTTLPSTNHASVAQDPAVPAVAPPSAGPPSETRPSDSRTSETRPSETSPSENSPSENGRHEDRRSETRRSEDRPSERPYQPPVDRPVNGEAHPQRRATDRATAHHPMRRADDPPATARSARPAAQAQVAARHSVSLVVPAHNEARNIAWVFEQIPSCVDEVILVDGASSDATVPMARHCLPTVRSVQQSGPGKGNALRTGFAAATGEYVVMMDADGSMWPGEIPHYLHFLDNGFDFVKGSRCIAGGGSLDLTRIRSLGNRALLAVVNRLYDASLTDLCYGYCAFRRSFLSALDLRSTGFEIEAEMIAHALRSGLRIAEVPSLELPRRSGRSHLHAVSDGRRVLRTLIAERPGARSPAAASVGEH
ncbi:glycosyltransferase [Kitasatospora sp. NPDC048538]|uniref:glycosyltransferase family 2 protein n=1 Tax=unclassified Kitasatospora TaxID=2633591 RepID=UPI0033D2E4A0